jgi:type VI secretion system protein ImpL
MMRVLIGILIFVAFMALVIGDEFAPHFEGTKLILFCVILGFVGALTIAFVIWYMHRSSGDSSQGARLDTPDGVNLNALLRDADARVKQPGRGGAKSLASLPLIYAVGDENSTRTQTVLQFGLDPELIAGNVYGMEWLRRRNWRTFGWRATTCLLRSAEQCCGSRRCGCG